MPFFLGNGPLDFFLIAFFFSKDMSINLIEEIDKKSESPYPIWALSAFSNN
jgi:hypothetical protein